MRRFVPLLALAVCAPLAAADKNQLQQFVEGVQSLSAQFEQVQKDERGTVLQQSSGRLWLQRPGSAATAAKTGMFRWSYEKPYQQLMVCDGQTLWLYDPDLKQVTVRPAGASLQGTPAQLLTDRKALERHFKVKTTTGADPHLLLLPKAMDSDFKSVELWLKGGAPARMRFHDQLGGETDVRFSAVKQNAPVDAAQFSFKPPKGTEIIEAEETRRP